MARELQALRNQKVEESGTSTASPSIGEASLQSPEQVSEISGPAIFDESEIDVESFQLGTYTVDKDTAIDVFRV